MSEKDVVTLLRDGSLEQFLDCLDFAPAGVIELIKKFAVELPLEDYKKREALKAKTGFDVDRAVVNAGQEPDEKEEEKVRREVEAPTSGRRTTATNYKIITKG